VVSGSGAVTPKSFTAVATAPPPPSSPSQPQPAVPTSADQQKPIVTFFDVKKVGDTVTVSYSVKDLGGSGLKQVELWRSPNNSDWAEITTKRRLLSGNGPVSGSFSDIPPSAGTYYYGVHVVDQAGNWNGEGGPKSVTFGKSPVATAPPPPSSPSQPQPAVPAPADRQKPIVTRFDVKTVGDTVTISYTVTDLGGSGLKQVELWRSSNNRDWAEISTKRLPLLGPDPVSDSFPDTPPSGTYYYGIHVVDQAGNWNSEGGPKSATVGINPGLNIPIKGSRLDDHFKWPINPQNLSGGHFDFCRDWEKDPRGCYWLSDTSTNVSSDWRDVQPFQLHYYKTKLISGYHLGADYNIGAGDSDRKQLIYPTSTGEISKVLTNACGWGNIVFIRHHTSFGIYTSMYAHIDWIEGKPPVEKTFVDGSVPIAQVGKGTWNCGKTNKGSYPAHLHFEIREGDNVVPGRAYTPKVVVKGPQGQIDPNNFIKNHR
jgi:murein DD-endopeptidase MepM/ murein hydrolase activator NlpD